MSRLAAEQIKQIQDLYKEGYTQLQIAVKLDVCIPTVCKYLDPREQIKLHDYGKDRRYKLTEKDVADIRRRANEGEAKSALAREYGLTPSTISYYTVEGRKESVNTMSKNLRSRKLKTDSDIRKKYRDASLVSQKRRRDLINKIKKGEQV